MSEENYRPRSFGLSELIQTGILFTLLGIAFGLGQLIQRIDSKFEAHNSKFEDHEKRISRLEG